MKNRLSVTKVKPPVEAPTEQHLLTKSLMINFDELIISAVYNKIHIFDSRTLKPVQVSNDCFVSCGIQTLDGHDEMIVGLDISQIQKTIVTISEHNFILHCLKDTDPVTENNVNEQYPRPRIT